MSNEAVDYFFASIDSHIRNGLNSKDALIRAVDDYAYVFHNETYRKNEDKLKIKHDKCIIPTRSELNKFDGTAQKEIKSILYKIESHCIKRTKEELVEFIKSIHGNGNNCEFIIEISPSLIPNLRGYKVKINFCENEKIISKFIKG